MYFIAKFNFFFIFFKFAVGGGLKGDQVWAVALIVSIFSFFVFMAIYIECCGGQFKPKLRAYCSTLRACFRVPGRIRNTRQIRVTPGGSAQHTTAPPRYNDSKLQQNPKQTVNVKGSRLV